jgi:hypothetical protein
MVGVEMNDGDTHLLSEPSGEGRFPGTAGSNDRNSVHDPEVCR